MNKNERKQSVMTIILIFVLMGISSMILKSAYQYYGGPEYKIDCYIHYLNQGEYDKVYRLLAESSLKDLGSQADIEAYYKKIYEKEKQLVFASKIGCRGLKYQLKYQYEKNMEKGEVTLIKEKGKWKIKFPFEVTDVEVFAPLGAKVYLESQMGTYNMAEGKYELKNVLPGTYLLKVAFAQEEYKDYYNVLRIPEEKSYEIPYETAHVRVDCAPGLKVSLNQFVKMSKGKKVEFNDILLMDYTICVEDEKGNLETQKREVEIQKGDNRFDFRAFKLTKEGQERLEQFIEAFYTQYIEAIKNHSNEGISNYFVGNKKADQLNLFNQWYIDLKDIQDAKLDLKVNKIQVDEKGQVHVDIEEQVELCNKEYDEILEKDIERNYKVILDFKTTINILQADWKIVDREIQQSLVAVQDSEGKWVQY